MTTRSKILSLMLGFLATAAVWAGDTDKNQHEALTAEVKGGNTNISQALPRRRGVARELNVYQALAAAITRTSVLTETRTDRLYQKDSKRKNIVVRGNRVTMRYTEDLYETECYLAVGPRQKWLTVNGYWAAGRVNASALSRAIKILHANGYTLDKVTVSISDRRQVLRARKLLHQLNLGKISIVGHDPNSPTHASVSFKEPK